MRALIHNTFIGLLFFSIPFLSCSQWIMSDGLDGGKINEITNIDSVFFASTDFRGVFTNKSGSWEPAHQDITFNKVITAGNYVFIYGNECLRSPDYGDSWEVVTNLGTIRQITSIDTVLFFTKNYEPTTPLLRSFDFGTTFDTVQTPFQENIVPKIYCDDSLLIIHPKNSQKENMIFYSGDYGFNWDSLNLEGLFQITLDFVPSKIKYLEGTFWTITTIILTPGTHEKVIVYQASSDKWIDVSIDSLNRQFFNDITEYNHHILCSHDSYSVLKFVIEDSSWVEFANGSKNVNQFLHYDDALYCATDQGAYSLDSNGNWSNHTLGLSHRNVTSMDTINGKIYLTANNELFCSGDEGNSFECISNIYGNQIVTTDSAFYLISTNGFWISRDEGNTWQSYTDGIEDVRFQRFSHFSISPQYYYLGTWESMYRTPTGIIDWTKLNTWPFDDIKKIESIDNTVIYSANYWGSVLLFSDNYGNSFTPIGGGYHYQFNKIGQSYYILEDSILYSDDLGKSWNSIPYPYLDHLKDNMDRIGDTVIVIGYEWNWGDLILMITHNSGEIWTDISDNLQIVPDVGPEYCKFIKIINEKVFVSSENGLWHRDDLIVSVPENASLDNNIVPVNIYPVPARNELIVDFVFNNKEPVYWGV